MGSAQAQQFSQLENVHTQCRNAKTAGKQNTHAARHCIYRNRLSTALLCKEFANEE